LARNPLNYSYAIFLVGWCAACYPSQLRDLCDRYKVLAALLCLLGFAIWTASHLGVQRWHPGGIVRAGYTLSVVVALALLARKDRLPRLIRFLSENSLAIYLYHHMFQLMIASYLTGWHPAVRILTMGLVGLAGAGGLCLGGRRLLGSKARSLLGT
jgi:peptidoglycan/LPS O-acetylase OafA/YrhL